MPKIVVTLKDQVLQEVVLTSEKITIGREAGNHIRLENPAVSRFHAEIYKQGWPYFIEDLKSTNGTQLNGRGLSWKSALNHNDRITIGKHVLVYVELPGEFQDRPKSAPGAESTILIRRG